jgi:hypothetical protein
MAAFGHDFELAKAVGDYRPESWEKALSNGASIWGETYRGTLFFNAKDVQYLLSIYRVDETLAFLYSANGIGGVHLRYLVSVADADQLDRFVAMPDLADMPVGSFLPWTEGAAVICDFLRDPSAPPISTEWSDISALSWPAG